MPWKVTVSRFFLVGLIGFCVDALVLQTLAVVGSDPLMAQFYAVCIAILVTFLLNRSYTFGDTDTPILRLFIAYLGTQCAVFGVNYVIYALLVRTAPPPVCSPLVALAIAAVVAMGLSYAGSRLFVFSTSGNGLSKNVRPPSRALR
jgi:putative flippase GtrA